MYKLSLLTAKLPTIQQSRIVSSGFAMWVVWSGKISAAVSQTLFDHGCIMLSEDSNQALWFSFGDECFRALARLSIWARLNPMPVYVQVFPVTFLIGYKFETSLSMPSDLAGQEIQPPNQMEIWVHPKAKDKVETIPGLELKPTTPLPGMAAGEWELFQADPSLTYPAALGWLFVIRPVGNINDRATGDGWHDVFRDLQPILEKLAIKYIFNEGFLVASVDTVRLLKSWLREVILLLKGAKEENRRVWPCVVVGVKKGPYSFNDELPRKIPIAWNQLVPGLPHLSYVNALILGKEFRINELRYSVEQNSVDDWCCLTLTEEEGSVEMGELNLSKPKTLLAGEMQTCFYCGMRNHSPRACPSRTLMEWRPEIWEKVAVIGLEAMNSAFAKLDKELAEGGPDALPSFLSGEGNDRVLLQAMFDIGAPMQHRMLRIIWRSRGKDMPSGLRQLGPAEGEYIWAALDSLRGGNMTQVERLLTQAGNRFPRSYQPRSLQGFMALENDDLEKAQFYFREAERMSATPLQQAYLLFLQGRAMECQEEYERATAFYKHAQNVAPRWHDAIYRQGVCMVKIGFTDQALSMFQDLIYIDPNFFNKVLLDLELERDRIHILSGLWALWSKTKAQVEEKGPRLDKTAEELPLWFIEGDEFLAEGKKRIDDLQRLKSVNNLVAAERFIAGLQTLNQDMNRHIEAEVQEVNGKMDAFYESLREVYKEAAWFPFPKLLRDFNRDFNASVDMLRFIKNHPLQVAENFKRSQQHLLAVEERIKELRSRLVTLRIVRESTFFTLLLGRNFMWLELAGLGLSLLCLPLLTYISHQAGGNAWWSELLLKQKWQIQKGLILIVSIAAMALAALKTAIMFEKKKAKMYPDESGKAGNAGGGASGA